MGVLRKVTISTVATLLLTNTANAGMSSFVQSNLGGTSTSASHYDTASQSYWTAGSNRIRYDTSGTVNPFSVTLPSLEAGCNGIDIDYGGFGYIKDSVANIISALPDIGMAFAVKLAYDSLNKEAGNIISEFTQMANQINSINYDTCQMGQTIAGFTGKKLTQIANKNVSAGTKENWAKAKTEVEDGLKSINKFITDAKTGAADAGKAALAAEEELSIGSVIDNAATENSFSSVTGDLDSWKALLRGMFGDVVGYVDKERSNSGEITITTFLPTITPSDFANTVLNGGDIKGTSLTFTKDDNVKTGVVFADKTITVDTGGILGDIADKITGIVDNISSDSEITEEQKNFINSMPIPIYQIANVMSQTGDKGADKVAMTLAIMQLDYLSNIIIRDFKKTIFLYQKKHDKTLGVEQKENIAKLYEFARQNRKSLNDEMNKLSQNNKSFESAVETYRKLGQDLLIRNPLWRQGSGQ